MCGFHGKELGRMSGILDFLHTLGHCPGDGAGEILKKG